MFAEPLKIPFIVPS